MKSFLFALVALLLVGYRRTDGQHIVHYSLDHLPRLSPRPESVAGVRNGMISLNGTWKFTGGGGSDENIKVPGEWEMQGFHLDSAGTAKYARTFNVPDDWKGKRVKLRFDAVSSHGVIKINGKTVGEHEGSFVPFEFDITREIHPGNNSLEMNAQSQSISDVLACTSQYAGHAVGGILRKVTLFALPEVNIAAFTYVTRFDRDYENATLMIPFEIANEGNETHDAAVLFELKDESGKPVPLAENKFSVKDISSGTSRKDTVALQVESPEKWNPEHPYRYTLITTLLIHGKRVETYEQKIGFREIEIRGNQLFVNNHPVKLHGVCRHSIYPFTGRSVPAALCLEDALLFREGNCNYIRTSHYPPEEEFLDACDSLGLFVESESSLCWMGHGAAPVWRKWDYKDPRFLPYMINANLEKMIADRNHPSVVSWSLGNESVWSPLWDKVNKVVKRLDPSRPTAFQDQCWGSYNNAGSQCDIANYHYPGLNAPAVCDTMLRPVIFDEYLHVENYNRREVLTDPFIRADWGGPLHEMYDSMYSHAGNLGGAIWAGIDDIFHMPPDSISGYGPWGVIDGWRRKKPEFFEMKKSYAPVVISNLDHPLYQNGKIILQVENRYDFTNLSALTVSYKTPRDSGTVKANVPPHGQGSIEIPLSQRQIQNSKLVITFNDPRGFICQKVLVSSPKDDDTLIRSATQATIPFQETPEAYVIKIKKVTYKISKATGQIEKADINGINAIDQGPILMILPLNRDDGGGSGIAGRNYQSDIQPFLYKGCKDWKASSVKSVKGNDGSLTIVSQGECAEASGTETIKFSRDGMVRIEYRFSIKDTVKINPRQWGVAFTLPVNYQTLTWKRHGRWSIYPENAIARNEGTASANPIHLKYVEAWEKPAGDWSSDANDLGSRDFRSTKAHIYFAQLTNIAGAGIKIFSDGTQAARSWINGDKVMFLIANYNTGGSDGFSADFYDKERMPLTKGSILKGIVRFKLLQ